MVPITDIPKPTKICAKSGKELVPGDTFFSVLHEERGDMKRRDYAPEHWECPIEEQGPQTNKTLIGWWKTKLPDASDKKMRLAPDDILLHLFEELALQPEKADMRYVLTLLLIRRHLFRYEREEMNEKGQKMLSVYAIKENATLEVPIALPDKERLEAVQKELAELLYN